MTQQSPFSKIKLDKTMDSEQFNQVVEAILAGRYSWACVLFLRIAGYNPLHYIPYRTYNRLLKENCQNGSSSRQKTDLLEKNIHCSKNSPERSNSEKCTSQIDDLCYLEAIDKQETEIRGGYFNKCFLIPYRAPRKIGLLIENDLIYCSLFSQ